MNILLGFIKHLLLFVFANLMASFILGIIFNLSKGSFDFSILKVFGQAAFVAMFGMFFTIIPYKKFLHKIIHHKTRPLWLYAYYGSMAPIILYVMIFLVVLGKGILAGLAIIVVIAVIGAFCGFIYGVLDTKIHFSPKSAGGQND